MLPHPLRLYCATTNPGKLREFRLTLEPAGVELRIVPGIEKLPAPRETGLSFEENALLKALYYSKHSPGPVFSDDSGLEVDALGGEPGVFSARYAGPDASDRDNNRLLLERMQGIADRTARFVCVIALADAGRLLGTFHGAVEGRLLDAPAGENGFGYDPLFHYPPFGCTFGEAPLARKLEVSHRSQALRAMLAYLEYGSSTENSRSSSSRR